MTLAHVASTNSRDARIDADVAHAIRNLNAAETSPARNDLTAIAFTLAQHLRSAVMVAQTITLGGHTWADLDTARGRELAPPPRLAPGGFGAPSIVPQGHLGRHTRAHPSVP